jgi:hypothetical protein
MKHVNLTPALCLLLFAGCGLPTKKTYDPRPGARNAPEGRNQPQEPIEEEYPTQEEEESQNQPEIDISEDQENTDQTTDPFGQPYDPDAEVPYGEEYAEGGSNQYDPNSTEFYDGMNRYRPEFEAQYPRMSQRFQRPFLSDRYKQHRGFLNFERGFRNGRSNDDRRDRDRDRFDNDFRRSKRWVNQDLYNEARRTCDQLKGKNYKSRRNLDDGVRDAIRRRDHRRVAELHDALLEEAEQE